MNELEDRSVHLMTTSPPYFNAPFDYKDFFQDYDEYLQLIAEVAKETYRVLDTGRIACVNIDDMLVEGEKFPIVADTTKLFRDAGFRYRDKIIWVKPEGYIRISRRSGVQLQNPYPMYFYPDNLQESILIFQKGKFDYKKVNKKIKESSKVDISEFQKHKWFLSVWKMTNVLPNSKLEKSIAAFPEELPMRLIKLFTYLGDTVLDPFLGSGTTTKVSMGLGRNSIGFEINPECLAIIKKKIDYGQKKLKTKQDEIEIIIRNKSEENIKK